MPDFNIRDSWGQKIGSIEEKGPSFLDSLAQMQQMKRMIQYHEREVFINGVYDLLDTVSNQVKSMTAIAELGQLQGEIDVMISQNWLDWHEAVKKAPSPVQARKLQNYVQNELAPLAEDIKENIEEWLPAIQSLTKLNSLLDYIDAYYEFHNESCDRVNAQGLTEIEVTDKLFIKLNDDWGRELDRLIEFHTKVVTLVNRLDSDEEFESIFEDIDAIFERSPDLQTQVENLVNLTNGREKAAERVLSNQSASQLAPSLTDELGKLASMKNEGLLTDEEFETAKKKLLSQ